MNFFELNITTKFSVLFEWIQLNDLVKFDLSLNRKYYKKLRQLYTR